MDNLPFIDSRAVREKLSPPVLIPVIREAMIALSTGKVDQLLRSFIPVKERHIFALMPAVNHAAGHFGVKVLSVFPDSTGEMQHEGYILLFAEASGRPLCMAKAEDITRLRTAAASAVATDALARADAAELAVLGTGKQAAVHIGAIAAVRKLRRVRIWGRDRGKAAALARAQADALGLACEACGSVEAAVADADIICTVTGARDPILNRASVKPGTHINAVGSSTPGPAEIDNDLVAVSRFIADHRPHVLLHGGEFLRAKKAGLVTDDHVVAEIGEVLAGLKPGRTAADQITVYKSLGHAVQDLATLAWLFQNR
jgi:ornithine cyclodeaminase/alanine dehydrogenase-like protein (mu-crystallin family)